jgi:hypothetical protein
MDSDQDSAERAGRRRARSKKGAVKAGAAAKGPRGAKGRPGATKGTKGGKGARGAGANGARGDRREKKSEYFLKPAKQGAVSVFRRPRGNRIEPKLCGTMSTRAAAIALVRQLERAESVVNDLFLEATDDGIEALEEILRISRESVERRAARHQPRHSGQMRAVVADAPPAPASALDDGAADAYAVTMSADPDDLAVPDPSPAPEAAGDSPEPRRRRRPRPRRPRSDQ